MNTRLQLSAACLCAFLVLAGCAKPVVDDVAVPPIKAKKAFAAAVDAGVPIPFDNKSIFVEASARHFVARTDPFALNHSQMDFEKSQEKERALQDLGGFYEVIAPPEPVDVVPVLEPQPYRRLAGVVVGQSVIGIIELNGSTQELIRPGQLVPGTEWRVVSIDADKAVLRRGGNNLPHEIVVRLESRPFGGGNPAPGNGPGGTGTPGGGRGVPPSGGGGGARGD